jgi:fatty acid desaturase
MSHSSSTQGTSAPLDAKSLSALIVEWIIISLLMWLAIHLNTAWLYLAAGVIIATRQHALLILFHDAVHGHLARRRWLNDALINLFAGIPALLPVELYRPLHLLHHRTIGTADDPERRLLYADQTWEYRPLEPTKLVSQLLGDLLLINGIRTIQAWMRAAPAPRIAGTTICLSLVWVAAIAAAAVLAPGTAFRALLLWFVPLLTVTQLLQKLRSYAEHSGGPNVTPGWPHWTYSWRVGVLGRASVWPYNINYHREHHAAPQLRWHELPGSAATNADRLDGRRLWPLLYRSQAPSVGGE